MALREAIDGCPAAITKVRAKRIELEAYIAAGLMTRERAQASYLKFASLIIAHVREHGPESEAEVASE
jgi:DNA primase